MSIGKKEESDRKGMVEVLGIEETERGGCPLKERHLKDLMDLERRHHTHTHTPLPTDTLNTLLKQLLQGIIQYI